jgi:hypothetical protein
MSYRKELAMAGCWGLAMLLGALEGVGRGVVGETAAPGLTRIETTLVDPAATGYGTFQSHKRTTPGYRASWPGTGSSTSSISPRAIPHASTTSATTPTLVSNDNGATWHDHALSDPFDAPYAVGGCRVSTPDGHIIGSFTARVTSTSAPEGIAQVHCLKIRTGLR